MGEQNLAELLGRVDVEAMPGELEDALADAFDLCAETFGKAVENGGVDADAGLLHAEEHGSEGQIDFAVDAVDGDFPLRAKAGTRA